jgi:peptidoglycan lytic transglycosylase
MQISSEAQALGKTFYPILNPQSPILVIATLVAITIAGCSSAPSKPGGYYLDDGPGANPPADLDSIPEPTPKTEPINKYTSRPYVVLGRTYAPHAQLVPYKERGVATWYGKRYHGQKTSSGEVYDMYAFSAAHTLLPLPSYARVTNVANGKSVVVRVNDRGPFHGDRLIDLSYAAAHRIGIVGQGSAMVEVESLIPGSGEAPVLASTPVAPAPVAVPVSNEAGSMFVQLGAFSVEENADAFLRKMRLELRWLASSIQLYRGDGLYKVHAGPYPNRGEAERAAERIRQELGFTSFVLTR